MDGPRVDLPPGSRGVVTGFEPNLRWPTVRFVGKERVIPSVRWTVSQGGSDAASRTQVPLMLAWAMTIHRSQGITIDRLSVDLDGVFEFGHAFVALSRCSSLEGLTLARPIQARAIRVHPEVVRFYDAQNGARVPPPLALTHMRIAAIGRLVLHTRDEVALESAFSFCLHTVLLTVKPVASWQHSSRHTAGPL